jgi:hypothetical protein
MKAQRGSKRVADLSVSAQMRLSGHVTALAALKVEEQPSVATE